VYGFSPPAAGYWSWPPIRDFLLSALEITTKIRKEEARKEIKLLEAKIRDTELLIRNYPLPKTCCSYIQKFMIHTRTRDHKHV
jgi:hypothetical protein